MPPLNRPDIPDRALLDEALANLTERMGLPANGLRWEVGERMDRKRSTLFPLALVTPSGERVATAFYKAGYFPTEDPTRHVDRARQALERSRSLGDRFASLVEDENVVINVTLAADPATLRSVTLGLEGSPMGASLRLISTSTRRSEAGLTCYRVGRAVRILESLDGAVESGDEIAGSSERKVGAAESFLHPSEIESLQAKLDGLLAAASAEGVVYAHGDLSPSNVLLLEERTGLIDFHWIPQLRGYDLSRFVHRLRHTTLSYRPWTDALVDAAIEGYGGPGVTNRPGWRYSELTHLLTTLRRLDRRGGMGRRTARQSLAELRSRIRG